MRRAVTLAVPEDANPAAGLISVLSPVGSALVGRRAGDRVEALLPDGRALELRIAGIAR
ncbi:nucleoside diphosphate kinase regulator [compost metagenome]